MIDIDGAHGEGGGQLVRTAVALAAVTGTPIRLFNVRAGREKPGLAPQHLAAVRAVGELCGARTEGLALHASSFAFAPGAPRGGAFRFEVGTAGSVTLVLQAALPVLVAAPVASRVTVVGGTDVRQAPPADYLIEVLLPHLARMGARVAARVLRRGYFPRGGGEIALDVTPARLRAVALDAPGALVELRGSAHVAHLPAHVAERMRAAALQALGPAAASARIATSVLGDADAIAQGGAIVAWARTAASVLGAGRVAERGERAEALGDAVGRALAADLASGVALDRHAADQLLVYLALAGGPSAFTTRELSDHARTAMWLIERFLPVRFGHAQDGERVRVTITPAASRAA
ncbi:MAG: RNA 3'-phosphate cyclase [Burkholderiales bacterium]|nr:RNA 3'-phosphate cyclase [Burkholderiales bacterium]